MKCYFLALGTVVVVCVGCAMDGNQHTGKGEYHAPPAAMMQRPGPMVDGPGPGVMPGMVGMAGGPGGMMGGPGGPGGFNPTAMLAPPFLKAMDENQDTAVSREEFQQGFRRWFTSWGGDKGPLSMDQLREGITRDLAPQPPL